MKKLHILSLASALAIGAATAESAGTAGVVVDCAKAAIAIKSETVATTVLNKNLMAGSD